MWIIHINISEAGRMSATKPHKRHCGYEHAGQTYLQARECHCERQNGCQLWTVLVSWELPIAVQEELEYRDNCEKNR